jgi:cation diffusion facilitator family transporter
MLRPEWVLVDHVGAIVVCVFILQAAWRITLPAARQLADAAPPEELRQAISRAIEAFPQVRTAHALRSRYIGTGVAVDFHIQVNPDLTVREGHDIAAALKRELLSTFADVRDVVVHIEPVGGVVSQVLYPKADAGPRASA